LADPRDLYFQRIDALGFVHGAIKVPDAASLRVRANASHPTAP
jgi:hypothetical protein